MFVDVQDTRKKQTAPPQEVLMQLDDTRSKLVVKKRGLERKIAELEDKRKANATDNGPKLGN